MQSQGTSISVHFCLSFLSTCNFYLTSRDHPPHSEKIIELLKVNQFYWRRQKRNNLFCQKQLACILLEQGFFSPIVLWSVLVSLAIYLACPKISSYYILTSKMVLLIVLDVPSAGKCTWFAITRSFEYWNNGSFWQKNTATRDCSGQMVLLPLLCFLGHRGRCPHILMHKSVSYHKIHKVHTTTAHLLIWYKVESFEIAIW